MTNVEIVRTGATSFAAWASGASVFETALHTGFGQWEVVDSGTGDCIAWADTRAEAFGVMVEMAMGLGGSAGTEA